LPARFENNGVVFQSPLMLLGVGAAVLPLVLHLLSRSRYTTVDWGGMLFLSMSGDARQRRSARMHRWALLLLRMGIIAVLAVALARPSLPGRWGATAGTQGSRLAAAIILDCSASMAFEENGVPRMDLARGAARQVLEALQPGDVAALVFTGVGPQAGGRDAAWADLPLTTDLQSVADRVALARAGTGRADIAAAARVALQQLQRAGDVAGRDVYVVCDRQKLSWDAARDDTFASMWREQQKAGHPTRLLVVPVGSNDVQNVVVESIELQNAPAIRGQPAEVEIRLRNDGPVQRASLPLSVKLTGGQKGFETKVDLAPDGSLTVKAPVKFDKAGSYVVTASVSSAGLTADDSLEAAVEAVDPVKVLIVSGDERPNAPFRSESDFLRVALAPFASAGAVAVGDPCTVEVLPIEKWADPQLGNYQVVVLANVEWLAPFQVRALEQFVYERGGGVLIALGSLTRAEDYNDLLYRFGAGLLPAELSPPTPADGSQATSLLGYRAEHPVFRFLRSRPGLLPSATVGRYFPVPARGDDPQAVSLAEYLTGESFLVEKQFGSKGKVLLLTTTIDADWTTLPLSNFYLPFAQSCARYLAAPSVLKTNLLVTQPIRLSFPTDVERTVTLTLPGGATQRLPVLRYTAQPEVNYSSTEVPGRYTLRIKEKDAPERLQHFVVRGPQQESRLEGMTEDDWSTLQRDLGLLRVEPSRVPISAELSSPRSGVELWSVALGVVFLLCVVELAIGRAAARDAGG
jgi:hypothetical protein